MFHNSEVFELMTIQDGPDKTRDIMRFVHKGRYHEVDRKIYCEQDEDPDFRVLTKDFHALGYTIRAGFRWNGASTPNTPLLRWTAPKFHRNLKASCLHDFLCIEAGKTNDLVARKKADYKYYMMLRYIERIAPYKYNAAYAGVRIGAKFGCGMDGKSW